jgi:ankyrin repeat protein
MRAHQGGAPRALNSDVAQPCATWSFFSGYRPLVALLFALWLPPSVGAQTSRDQELIAAAKRADTAAVRTLLNQGANVNARYGDGTTALHWAVYRSNREAADLLIRSGAMVNAVTDIGITPLWVACSNAGTPLIARLLEAGADPNIAPPANGSPLMAAARTGNAEAVRLLIAHRADVNAKEASRGQTALMWAVAERHPDVVRELVAAGADVHARSKTSSRYVLMCCQDFQGDSEGGDYTPEGGFTPLLFAARVGDIESATRLLAAGANIEDTAPTGLSALALAAHSDQGIFAKFLLEKGANPNADGAGYTPLHAAIVRGNLNLLTALLAHGANPNVRQRQGSPSKRYSGFALDKTMTGATPFLLATRASQLEMMKALAAAGGDVNLTLDDGTTPIMAAARRQGREGRGLSEERVVQAMKRASELGSRFDATDRGGNTVLHIAAVRRLDTVVQFLADSGVPLNAKNAQGQTALAVTLAPLAPAKGSGEATFNEYNGLKNRTEGTVALLRKLGATE